MSLVSFRRRVVPHRTMLMHGLFFPSCGVTEVRFMPPLTSLRVSGCSLGNGWNTVSRVLF